MDDATGNIGRLIVLGASNVTRAFHVIAAGAARTWGPGVEIFAAHGLGRSFGAASSVHWRRLPAILECGLWRGLEQMPPRQNTRGDLGRRQRHPVRPPAGADRAVGRGVRRADQGGDRRHHAGNAADGKRPLDFAAPVPAFPLVSVSAVANAVRGNDRRGRADRARARSLERRAGPAADPPATRLVRLRPDPHPARHWSRAWGEYWAQPTQSNGNGPTRSGCT